MKALEISPPFDDNHTVAMQLVAHAYAFDPDHGLFVQYTPDSAWLFRQHEWDYTDDVCFNEIEPPKIDLLKGLIRRGRTTTEVAHGSESKGVVADLENLFCGWSTASCFFRLENM